MLNQPWLGWKKCCQAFDLQNNTLGSTGIKDTSGDLDIAVDATQLTKEQLVAQLTRWTVSQKQKPQEWIKQTGAGVHFKTPINGRPDLGYVQTDFMFLNNVPWSKFVLGAMPTDSKYKGRERNVLMNSIAKSLGYKLNQIAGIADRATDKIITDNPDAGGQTIVKPNSHTSRSGQCRNNTTSIQHRSKRDAKLADFRSIWNVKVYHLWKVKHPQ
jgi:hypothetical protein